MLNIILIFIIFYFILSKKKINEEYDGKISNASINECGDKCSKIYGCAGFGYDKNNMDCYLSKSKIISKPINSLYSDEYKSEYGRCNKLNSINLNDKENNRNYVSNATYQCSENEEGKEKTKLIINGTLQDISDGVDISLDKYKLIDINWPNEKKEINLEILKDSFDGKSKFLVSPKEHLGQYLYNHQCVTNIDHYDCLKSCELDDECRGVEFNRLLIKQSENGHKLYENVCCPKKNIKKIIDRRPMYDRGKYYIKLSAKQSEELKDFDNISIINSEN